jgi:histidine triad (HIT) family protein
MANNCLFCKIADGSIKGDVVYSNEHVVAFRDINPQAPVHVLVIPRRHIESATAVMPEDDAMVAELLRAAAEVARQEGIAGSGYRLVINNGPDAEQSVPHLHVHVLGGRPMTWPPG